ncbi:MAG: ATP synthase F0 subunit A [Spirochaetes bacterium]|nr:MAG: ATP synthase F0 subunit A [Spirochaetota bacterium]
MKELVRRVSVIFSFLLFSGGTSLFAESGDVDISGTLFHHILNGRSVDLFPGVPAVTLPLGISVHQAMLFVSVVLILLLFLRAARNKSMKPKGVRSIAEIMILFVRDDIVYPVMGKERGEKWLSFFISLFVFLLTVNLIGLIPAFKTATGNINVTTAMAVIVFFLTFAVGFKELGVPGFFKNMYPEGVAFPIGIFVVLLEFIGLFTKSIVLSLRLFANMFAGHLAILSFLVLIFVISPFFSLVSVPFAVFTYVLEVLVALLQAFVFTLLSCIFISMASTPEGE